MRPFQVDLRGVVDLLSRHIYSSPRVYLRELLQNGVDAITARRGIDGFEARIDVLPAGDGHSEFVIRDTGIGLTADQVTDLLATVGRSSKRDILDLPKEGYLGQFGIGLLSCFMVAETIVIRSQSATGAPPIEWRGTADGTFSVEELDEELPVGTSVHLVPRPDARHLLETELVRELAADFGQYLPIPVHVALPDGTTPDITVSPAFLSDDPQIRLDAGEEVVGGRPLAAIPVDLPAHGLRGTLYVLPSSPPPGAPAGVRMHLGRMLLGERVTGILPDWAFFLRGILDTDRLRPTASRESLVDDDTLAEAREAVAELIRRWLRDLERTAPALLHAVIAVHQLALKNLLLHDDDLARTVLPWLALETTDGPVRVPELVGGDRPLRYTETLDEFRQVAGFAPAGSRIINGGYTFDAEIVRRLPELHPGLRVERIDVIDELEALAPPDLADRASARELEQRCDAVLAEFACSAIARSFPRDDLPALYVTDPEALRAAERRRARDVSAAGPWGAAMRTLESVAAASYTARTERTTGARLCLNIRNPLIRSLGRVTDAAVLERTVQLVYVQAVLAAHRPLGPRERSVMTRALSDLVALSVGVSDPAP